ncbi:hypothetical protein CYMTET_24380, partial [Cymbomonas tetramitiformis]
MSAPLNVRRSVSAIARHPYEADTEPFSMDLARTVDNQRQWASHFSSEEYSSQNCPRLTLADVSSRSSHFVLVRWGRAAYFAALYPQEGVYTALSPYEEEDEREEQWTLHYPADDETESLGRTELLKLIRTQFFWHRPHPPLWRHVAALGPTKLLPGEYDEDVGKYAHGFAELGTILREDGTPLRVPLEALYQ